MFFNVPLLLTVRLKAPCLQCYKFKNNLVYGTHIKYVIYSFSFFRQSYDFGENLCSTFFSSCGKYCKSRNRLMKGIEVYIESFSCAIFLH
jgi:hypothetical protein